MRRWALSVFMAAAAASGAVAQLKVGVINSQKAIAATAEIKKAQLDLEARFRPQQQKLQQIQKELQDLQAQIQAGKLSQEGEQELNAEGQRKQREAQRLEQDLRDSVDQARSEVLGRAGQRMQEVVHKLAADKGLDMVFDASTMLYFKTTLELTDDAIAAFDKAYPVK